MNISFNFKARELIWHADSLLLGLNITTNTHYSKIKPKYKATTENFTKTVTHQQPQGRQICQVGNFVNLMYLVGDFNVRQFSQVANFEVCNLG